MRLSHFLAGVSVASLALPAMAQTAPPPAAQAPLAPAAPVTSLREAMVQAYATNPDILTERANLRATDENVPIARAEGLPSARSTAGYTENTYNSNYNGVSPVRQVTAGINLSAPIYSGGSVSNSIRAADARVEAGQANLRTAEANLFTNVVAAYMNVIRDEAIVRLNQQNVNVLDVNLRAARDRFEVGDLTRTDVAQSEARLAIARGQLQAAQAQLITSRESYIRVVGSPPGELAPPPPLPGLPGDAGSAVSVAMEENPSLDAAGKAAKAAEFDVKVARASRLPTVSVGTSSNYFNNMNSGGLQLGGGGVEPQNDGIATSAGVTLSLPLFQGGAPAARVRQAQARQSAALETVTSTERNVIANVRSAFASYRSAQEVIQSARIAVDANRLSLEGVRAENSVGTRTILDILNAEQELLNSQVTYVTAERDAYVAGFALLASMGRAEAADLGLDGGPLYDPIAHYKDSRRRWGDWSDGPKPTAQGTRTIDSPAQNPNVSGPVDPVGAR